MRELLLQFHDVRHGHPACLELLVELAKRRHLPEKRPEELGYLADGRHVVINLVMAPPLSEQFLNPSATGPPAAEK